MVMVCFTERLLGGFVVTKYFKWLLSQRLIETGFCFFSLGVRIHSDAHVQFILEFERNQRGCEVF